MTSDYPPAVKLLSKQIEERARLRARWKQDAGDLLDAHQLSLSAVYAMIDRFSGRRFDTQPRDIEGRMSLTAQFMQGVDICEVAISEGLYSQAAALLKQQIETIAAINEYEKNKRKEGKTPRIGSDDTKDFGCIYGDLNNIAHVSRHDLARHLVTVNDGDLCAPSLIPQYNSALARFLYGYHVYFIIVIGMQIERIFKELFHEGFLDEELRWLFVARMILLREKVIKLSPDARQQFPHIDIDKILNITD